MNRFQYRHSLRNRSHILHTSYLPTFFLPPLKVALLPLVLAGLTIIIEDGTPFLEPPPKPLKLVDSAPPDDFAFFIFFLS